MHLNAHQAIQHEAAHEALCHLISALIPEEEVQYCMDAATIEFENETTFSLDDFAIAVATIAATRILACQEVAPDYMRRLFRAVAHLRCDGLGRVALDIQATEQLMAHIAEDHPIEEVEVEV